MKFLPYMALLYVTCKTPISLSKKWTWRTGFWSNGSSSGRNGMKDTLFVKNKLMKHAHKFQEKWFSSRWMISSVIETCDPTSMASLIQGVSVISNYWRRNAQRGQWSGKGGPIVCKQWRASPALLSVSRFRRRCTQQKANNQPSLTHL